MIIWLGLRFPSQWGALIICTLSLIIYCLPNVDPIDKFFYLAIIHSFGILFFSMTMMSSRQQVRFRRYKDKNILFVFAHPDDETMFFLPSIGMLIYFKHYFISFIF